MAVDAEWTIQSDEGQQSVNTLWPCKYVHCTVIWLLLCITYILVGYIEQSYRNIVTASFCT
jgi:hypothetical protein